MRFPFKRPLLLSVEERNKFLTLMLAGLALVMFFISVWIREPIDQFARAKPTGMSREAKIEWKKKFDEMERQAEDREDSCFILFMILGVVTYRVLRPGRRDLNRECNKYCVTDFNRATREAC